MKHELRDVLSIGVVTRTPKIDRELQQNHNRTHNAIEHGKTRESVGPLSKLGVDFLDDSRPPESKNHSQPTHNASKTRDPLTKWM